MEPGLDIEISDDENSSNTRRNRIVLKVLRLFSFFSFLYFYLKQIGLVGNQDVRKRFNI